MASTVGKPITCRAAVLWELKKPLSIETIEVAPPKAGEVRIKILYTGVCRSDHHALEGTFGGGLTPIILGHEGSGIVESVGAGVTHVQPGDHVIPLYIPQCRECKTCKNPKTNICMKGFAFRGGENVGRMLDGTSRFTCKGKPLFHFMSCSTFSEYTVVDAICVCKIDKSAPLDKVCLIGCCVPTGYGAAINDAKVEPGSSCAVWGLGGIGLAAVMGCKKAGAARIIGVDVNPTKFEKAKQFGATECVNPNDYDKPIQQVLIEMTDGGLDYTIECIGNVSTMRAAVDACHIGWGVSCVIGLVPPGHELSVVPMNFCLGKSITGTGFGGWKSRDSVPKLVNEYLAGELKVDEFITDTMGLERINEAFDLMLAGKSIRSVVSLHQ